MEITQVKVFRPIPTGNGFSDLQTNFTVGKNCEEIRFEGQYVLIKVRGSWKAVGLGNLEFADVTLEEKKETKPRGRPKKQTEEEAIWA